MDEPKKYNDEPVRKKTAQELADRQKILAEKMGITLEEYREIGCYDEVDLDGSLKVYWSSSADSGIVAKIRGKQAVDDEHVTISQHMSQLGDGF